MSSNENQQAMVLLEAPCEDMFEQLAASAPGALLTLVNENCLQPSELTLAAEALGRIASPEAETVLTRLLDHPSAVVREGAIYGLSHLGTTGATYAIRRHAQVETSPGVQRAIEDVLEL